MPCAHTGESAHHVHAGINDFPTCRRVRVGVADAVLDGDAPLALDPLARRQECAPRQLVAATASQLLPARKIRLSTWARIAKSSRNAHDEVKQALLLLGAQHALVQLQAGHYIHLAAFDVLEGGEGGIAKHLLQPRLLSRASWLAHRSGEVAAESPRRFKRRCARRQAARQRHRSRLRVRRCLQRRESASERDRQGACSAAEARTRGGAASAAGRPRPHAPGAAADEAAPPLASDGNSCGASCAGDGPPPCFCRFLLASQGGMPSSFSAVAVAARTAAARGSGGAFGVSGARGGSAGADGGGTSGGTHATGAGGDAARAAGGAGRESARATSESAFSNSSDTLSAASCTSPLQLGSSCSCRSRRLALLSACSSSSEA